MADNVQVTSGSGTSIATDQNGSDHVQWMKLYYGADGSFTAVSASAGLPVSVTSANTGIADGRKTVTTAGTRVTLASSTACKQVIITAETDNTGYVVVGGSTVVAALATRSGTPLNPGDSIAIEISNLSNVYLDAVVSTDGVTYTYFT